LGRWSALLASAFAVTWLAIWWWQGPDTLTQKISRGDLRKAVIATGRVETPHRVDLGAQITGTVEGVPIEEGQWVPQGAILVALESSELQATARQAQAALEQAQARLQQLENIQRPVAEQLVRQNAITLENAKAQFERQAALFSQQFIGEAALQESRKAVDLAAAQTRAASLQLAGLQPGGREWKISYSALKQAQASLEIALARLRSATVRAPVAGTLISRRVERGDVVQPGKALITLSPLGALQIIVQIDERNLALIAIGQHAIASADAFPNDQFEAILIYIKPGIDAQTGAVEVKLEVPEPPDFLRQDMTVSVEIGVAQRTNALLIPNGAIVTKPNGKTFAMTVHDGKVKVNAIKTGIHGSTHSEVIEGLAQDDQVIVQPQALRAGERVRAHQAQTPSQARD
jgi:HlyD family secretion protein